MSHGCGSNTSTDSYWAGWQADYVIDASGVKNRAMEWLSYLYGMQGELYYDTVGSLATAFTNQSGFGGTGDGNLLYPGTVANIGGTIGIPVASLRLKLIRDGMEDYEYLHLVAAGGDPAFADTVARNLFPDPGTYVPSTAPRPTAAQLQSARAQLAQRILELQGAAAPRPTYEARLHAAVAVDGALGEWSKVPAIVLDPAYAGSDNSATVKLAWDATNLYAAFSVVDGSLVVNEGGRDGELWDGDAVELMLDPLDGRALTAGTDVRHVIVNVAGDLLEARGAGAGEDRSVALGTSYAVTANGTVGSGTSVGYRVIAAVPWSGLGVTPAAGLVLGGDVALDDLDGTALSAGDWAGVTPFAQPLRWHALQLAGSAAAGQPGDGTGGGVGGGGAEDQPGAAAPGGHGCSLGGASDGASALASLWLSLVALALLGRRACYRRRA
jgi:hypothetical protein